MPPSGIDKLKEKRQKRTRDDQRLPPKRQNPGHSAAGDGTAESSESGGEVYTRFTRLPLDVLAHNPRNGREHYNDSQMGEMISSLGEFGQLQAIVVVSREVWLRHHPGDAEAIGDAAYIVDVGNRRLAAAREATTFSHLWADVRDDLGDGDEDWFDEAMVIENTQRLDLDPLAYAKVLQRMVNKPGASLRTVARRIGRSHGHVQQHIALLQLIPELRGELNLEDPETGHVRLTFKQARALTGLSPEVQRAVFAAGIPYTPPTADPPSEPDGVNPVSTPTSTRTAPPRISLPRGNPPKLASLLREHLSTDELAELVTLLLGAPDEQQSRTN